MTPGSVTLGDLAARGLGRVVGGDETVSVAGVRHDSREVQPGELFVAMPGFSTDGAKFAEAALASGAVAIVAERPLPLNAPQLVVDDARRALGPIASLVYGEPTHSLRVVGLTGTNGKTTTTWLIDEALTLLGARSSLLGTIETRGPHGREPAGFTTPEADAIARFARRVVDAGGTHLVMEVSSHALALHRADAVRFEVAAFTNLSQDHLDFHESMDEYFAAKARLFDELAPACAVINVDDPAGAELAQRLPDATRLVRVSTRGTDAELTVTDVSLSRDGVRASAQLDGARARLESPMLGAHNLDNLLLATGCLTALGHPLDEVVDALGRAVGAPGRLERVQLEGSDGPTVLVDYAHTPDALRHALATLRPITAGRLLVVFGCGGDRDRDKRPKMGDAAADAADLAIVTSDNPRTEDPFAILDAIVPAVRTHLAELDASTLGSASEGYLVVEDRARAIDMAVRAARAEDTVLIAGKGHEDYQIRGTEKLPFDDRAEARGALERRAGEGEG